jgi:hypothetical protein
LRNFAENVCFCPYQIRAIVGRESESESSVDIQTDYNFWIEKSEESFESFESVAMLSAVNSSSHSSSTASVATNSDYQPTFEQEQKVI